MIQKHSKNIILVMLILTLFSVAAYWVASDQIERWQTLKTQRELQALYEVTPSPQPSLQSTISPQPTDRPPTLLTESTTVETEIQPQFIDLLEINPDVIGWISIPGTKIDYPVVQGDDNVWYLNHNIYGEEEKAGTVFMDYRMTLDGLDHHQILYGHHLRQGTMFTDLMKYKDATFFQKNRRIIFDRLGQREVWEIFSVYVTSVDFYYIETQFADDQAWLDFIRLLQDKSMHDSRQVLTADDEVLTLSTCTYEFNNARFAVHARRVKNP